MTGEGFAFFRWHCLNRPISWRCEHWQHAYHLAFWKWGKR